MNSDSVFPDILTLLRQRAAASPDATALEDRSGILDTYRSLLDRVQQLMSALISEGGGVRGNGLRVGMVLANGPDMSRALLASACAGTVVPFNPAYTEVEFEDYFKELDISLLVTSAEVSPNARRVADRMGLPVINLEELIEHRDSNPDAIAPPAPGDVAMILLTSGSTGRCKKVPLTHRNICTSARDVCRSLALGPEDRCLSMWELFHIGGLVDLLLAPLHSGGSIITTGGFDADLFFVLLEKKSPTWFQGVPTALGELVISAQRKQIIPERRSLRFLRSVAAALPPAQMHELESLFGVPVIQTFGMTEGGPLITSTQLPPGVRKPGSVGISCGAEVGIFAADGTRISDGTSGEVGVRGDNVFSGYEGDPAANAAAFFDGWFRTGDMGRLDEDGHLFLTGRIKELINRGGEKINPTEVDSALLTHSAVMEAASFSVAHRTLGEDVAAAVVLRPESSVGERELRKHLSDQLVSFKIPQRILFLDSLPRNAVGKIDRLALAKIAEEHPPSGPESGGEMNEVESRVAAIWATELNLPEIGPDDDFFRLGGDSLSGLRMFLSVESAFSLKLSAEVLSDLTTVRELARRISNTESVPQTVRSEEEGLPSAEEQRQILAVMEFGEIPTVRPGSVIKVVNRNGSRPPLIWCFNIPALELRMMARYIHPDQPVYGLFSGGRILDRNDEKLWEIARLNVAELLEIFPSGNFKLGGNCQGGRIAWMIFKLLTEAGRHVETLSFHEFCNPNLSEFEGPILMMFPKSGRHKFYERIRWGEPGWEKPFRIKPAVSWNEGPHGGFFQKDGTVNLIRNLETFLRGDALEDGTLDFRRARIIWHVRRTPVLFHLFRGYCKFRSFLRYGPRKKYHPFSGEEIKRGRKGSSKA